MLPDCCDRPDWVRSGQFAIEPGWAGVDSPIVRSRLINHSSQSQLGRSRGLNTTAEIELLSAMPSKIPQGTPIRISLSWASTNHETNNEQCQTEHGHTSLLKSRELMQKIGILDVFDRSLTRIADITCHSTSLRTCQIFPSPPLRYGWDDPRAQASP